MNDVGVSVEGSAGGIPVVGAGELVGPVVGAGELVGLMTSSVVSLICTMESREREG